MTTTHYLQDLFYPVSSVTLNCVIFVFTTLLLAWALWLGRQAARLVRLQVAITQRRLRRLELDLIPFPEVKYFSRRQLAEYLQTRAPPPPLTLAPLPVPAGTARNSIHLSISESIAALDFRVNASRPTTVTVLVDADCKEVDEAIAAYNAEAEAEMFPLVKGGKMKATRGPTRAPDLQGKGKGRDASGGGKGAAGAGGADGKGASRRLDWMSRIAKSAGYYGTAPAKAMTATELQGDRPAKTLASRSGALCEKLKKIAQCIQEPISLPEGLGQRVDISIINDTAVASLRKPPSTENSRYALIIMACPDEQDESGELVRMITLVWHQKLPFLITPDVVRRVVITSSGCFIMEDVFGAEVDESKQSVAAEDCAICLTNPRSVIILPCRHKCVCNSCFTRMSRTNCPVCRAVVASFVQTTTTDSDEADGTVAQ